MPRPKAPTYRVTNPRMRSHHIEDWQRHLNRVLDGWRVGFRVKVDGIYGMGTRSISKTVAFGQGFTHEEFDRGITPELRRLSRTELAKRPAAMRRRHADRAKFRENLRRKFAEKDVAAPIANILVMTWGWTPGVHDGIDLICGPAAPIFAICDAEVIDVRAGGWWGNAPSGDVWKGDGIIQLRCLTDDGPFKKGMHIGYGHAEGADVRVGQRVEAGQRLGEAGLAVAWHIHLMANRGRNEVVRGLPVGLRGVGSFDPEPLVRYALAKS